MMNLNQVDRDLCADGLNSMIEMAEEQLDKAERRKAGTEAELIAMLKLANLRELQQRLQNHKDTP